MTDLLKALQGLKNDDGMTLKGFAPVTYKIGYQVGITGIETEDPAAAAAAIESYNGDCGVWFSNGIYYIDNSVWVSDEKEALTLGRACNQISILKWSDMSLIYC